MNNDRDDHVQAGALVCGESGRKAFEKGVEREGDCEDKRREAMGTAALLFVLLRN